MSGKQQQPDVAHRAAWDRFFAVHKEQTKRLTKFSREALAERVVILAFGALIVHPCADDAPAKLVEAVDQLIPNLKAAENTASANRAGKRAGRLMDLLKERDKARAEGRRPPPLPKDRKRRKARRKVVRHRIQLVKP